jgi:hypothetical protein
MLVTVASSALMLVRDLTLLSCALSATDSAATMIATGNSLMRFLLPVRPEVVVQETFRSAYR